MLVPIRMGTTAARNQQKHLSLSFAAKREFIPRGTQKHLNNTFSNTWTVQILSQIPRRNSIFKPTWQLSRSDSETATICFAWHLLFLRRSLVSWFFFPRCPTDCKGANKNTKIYFEGSTTVHNAHFFFAQTLCMNNVSETFFLLVSFSREENTHKTSYCR